MDGGETQPHVESSQGVSTNQHQSQGHDQHMEDQPDEPVRRTRRTTSIVWDHFTRFMVKGEQKAECHYCHKVLGAKSSNGTRHLLDHMNSCKKRKNKDIRQQILSMNQKTSTSDSNLSCYNFDGKRSRKDLAEMVIVREYPLVLVEHRGFRKFVGGLQPYFKVPSRNTLKNDIMKIYDFEKQNTMR